MESWRDHRQEGPMCWKERLDSQKLSSDFHMQTLLHLLLHVYVCMHEYTCSKSILLKPLMWGWRNDLANEGTCCSCRGPSTHMVVHSHC